MKREFSLEGMSCTNCAKTINNFFSKSQGIKKVKVSLPLKSLIVECDEEINSEHIIDLVKKLGYKAEEKTGSFETKLWDREVKSYLIRFILAATLTFPLLLGMFLGLFKYESTLTAILNNPIYQLITIIIIEFFIGYTFFISSYYSIINKKLNMNILVVLSTTLAIALSIYKSIKNNWTYIHGDHLFFETAGTIITLILLGKLLESLAKNKAKSSMDLISKLVPQKVLKKKNNEIIECSLSDLILNDIVIVKNGMLVPIDGKVINGEGWADNSIITGESKPVHIANNYNIFAGTTLVEGYIEILFEKKQEDFMINRIVDLLKNAQSNDIAIQKLVDKITAYFVPFLIMLAIVTFLGWVLYDKYVSERAILNAITTLIIACPCALGLASPIAIIVGSSKAAQNNILFKNGDVIEKLARANVFVFDKTGTLTHGNIKINSINIKNDTFDKDYMLSLLKSLEMKSSHPIAKALINELPNYKTFPVENFTTHTSKGLSGIVNEHKIKVGSNNWLLDKEKLYNKSDNKYFSILNLVIDEVYCGYLELSDTLRENSSTLIEKLNKLKIKTILLSGDDAKPVEYIANMTNIKEFHSKKTVLEKEKIIESLKQEKNTVVMVGDGVNDALALKKADIGITLSSSLDIALEVSDIIITSEDILLIIKAIKIAKKTHFKIKTNLFWAFIYNILSLPLAAFGLLLPQIAAATMMLSSLSVVINSLYFNTKKLS